MTTRAARAIIHGVMDVLSRNNVRVLGSGRPILLSHGFGCDQNMWRFVAPAFADDHRVVLFDHVGAGRSDRSAYDRSKYGALQGYAADVLEVCDVLGLEDVIFVGHSVSAMIGVLAANAAPSRFAKLVLVGPSPRYVNDVGYVGGFEREEVEQLLQSLDDNYLGWSQAMAPTIMGNPERPELASELTATFCSNDPDILRHFAEVTFLGDNRADLPQVQVESLILQCSQDVIAPLAVGQYVHRHTPRSQLVLMKATGHCPNLSAPGETIAAVKAFLA
jgi:sigma-B regulation protein RsbQ